MPKIVDYLTIIKENPYELDRLVNKRITDGWQPIGGLNSTVYTSGYYTYAQALVKYE